MKIVIKPYLINLLKENAVYVGIGIVSVILIIFSTFYNGYKTWTNQETITRLSKEISDLQNRVTIINSTLLTKQDLATDIKLLNTLLPNAEDYFSILSTLEELSQKSNFIVVSYSVNVPKSSPNKVKLIVEGGGDRTSFLSFLKEYNFGGGRLVTSDKIELVPQTSGLIKIDLTFYSKNVIQDKRQQIAITPQTLTEFSQFKNKITYVIKESVSEEELNTSYPKKTNPF